MAEKVKKEKKKSKILNNREVINLKEFMLLNREEQNQKVHDTLVKMYEDTLEIQKKYIEKTLNIFTL